MSKLLKTNQDAYIVHTGDPNLQALHMQCPVMHSYFKGSSPKKKKHTHTAKFMGSYHSEVTTNTHYLPEEYRDLQW